MKFTCFVSNIDGYSVTCFPNSWENIPSIESAAEDAARILDSKEDWGIGPITIGVFYLEDDGETKGFVLMRVYKNPWALGVYYVTRVES